MTTATRDEVRSDRADKGEWLNRLLDEVETGVAFQPGAKAVLRMRTRIFENMAEPVKVAA